MGHYDSCRPGYCGGCGAAPGNMNADGSCPFCANKRKLLKPMKPLSDNDPGSAIAAGTVSPPTLCQVPGNKPTAMCTCRDGWGRPPCPVHETPKAVAAKKPSTWTDTDEKAWAEMTARRSLVQAERRNAVVKLADEMHFRDQTSSELANALIANADALIAALTPFAKDKELSA